MPLTTGAAAVPSVPAVRVTLAEAAGSPSAPLVLRLGQELLAEVLSLDGESGLALLSMAGRRFHAHVPVAVEEGQVLRLAVADVSTDRLTLRLAPTSASAVASVSSRAVPATTNLGAVLDATAILAELELPATPELSAAVQALLEQGRPLTRTDVLAVRNAIVGQPEVVESARAAVHLQSLGVPPTPRALQLARAALAEVPPRPIGELVHDLLGAAGDSEKLATLDLAATSAQPAELRRVVTLIAEGPEAALAEAVQTAQAVPATTAEASPVAELEESLTAARPASTEPADAEPTGTKRAGGEQPIAPRALDARSVLARAVAAPDLPAAVRALAQTLHDRIELQQLANAASLAPATTQQTTGTPPPPSALSVTPPPTSATPTPGGDQASAATTAPQPAHGSPPAASLALSIPLAIGGQHATMELAIQRDPPSRRDAGEVGTAPIRAQFSVRLQRLGEVSADLRLSATTLRCRLSAPPGPAHDLLSSATADLRARWEQAGFHVDALDCLIASPGAPAAVPPPALYHVDLDV